MADDKDNLPGPAAPPAPAPASGPAPAAGQARPARRWLRRTLAGAGVTVLLLGGAVWLLGRESTLQQLVQRIATASGGQVVVTGVSGSLYHRMHIGRLVYRSKDSIVTADNIDINWSPLQYFSEGLAISELHVAGLTVESIGPSQPPKLPASLAAPFRLSLSDARLDRLTLLDRLKGSRQVIDQVRFKLTGDKASWHLQDAEAQTAFGQVHADATIAATRPFALQAKASLTQAAPATAAATPAPAPAQGSTGVAESGAASSAAAPAPAPAKLTLDASGNLSLLALKAHGTAGGASADATLQLAPFDPIILRAIDLAAKGINPAGYDAGWPKADLTLQLSARLAADQQISGQLAVTNQLKAAPLDQQGIPLQAISARVGGSLTDTRIDNVLLDLGPAGRFTGAGAVHRKGMDSGIDTASVKLHTDRINLKSLLGSLHQTAIAGNITLDSTATTQTLNAALAQDGLRLDLQATLADAQLHLQQARLLAKKGSISATGQLSLKERKPFKAALRADHFDPSAFGAYPLADINADINASGHLAPAWQVNTDFTLKPSKLSGQTLTGAGKLSADAGPAGKQGAVHLSGVDARLALGQNTADIKGNFGAPGEQLKWTVSARQLSAASSDLLGALSASGIISGSMDAPRSSFDAEARGLGLASAKHPVADSVLHASGDVLLAGPKKQPQLTLSGSALRFNPVAFGAYPSGSINADFSGSASLAADWRASVNLSFQPSTLSGAPLSGHARMNAAAGRVDNADIDLHLGANSLQAKGGFGSPNVRLDWKLDAPQLASAGPQFGGVLHASGALSGTTEKPAVTLNMDGANLHLPGQQQIKSIRGSATLGSTASLAAAGGDIPLVSDIELTGYATPKLKLDKARLQTSGSRSGHVLQASASNADFDAAVRVHGAWTTDTWTGAVDTLQNRGRFAFTLQAPAPLRLAAPAGTGVAGLLKPEQIALGAAVVKLPDGSIRIDSLEKTGATWRSKGSAGGVPVNYLAQLSDAWRDNVQSDMTVGAAWSLALQAAAKGVPPAIDGMLHVYREQGDITMTGTDLKLPLGLRTLDARVDVNAGTLRTQLAVEGTRIGQARLDATSQLRNGRLADDSPLSMTASANMGSLAWLAPLTGQPGMEIDGTLKLAMTGSGSIGEPQLNGDISGDKLVLNWTEQGIKLRNGVLQAHLAGDQLQLQKLSFDGQEGKAQADGWIRFANAEATMQLKLSADKLEVLARPDRTLVISGTTSLVRDAKHFQLDGKLRADRALIELAGQNTPTMSDDVVIVGRGAAPLKTEKSMPLNVDVEADLGDNFTLRGKGLDAQLAGAVRVRIVDRRPPRVNGSIRVTSGTYAAYGQKLEIERGVINFTGAYDNPGLNILAVRKRPEGEQLSETNVEAGVEVRGTALAPVAKLVSTPAVTDSDKLAWLVLGHGIDSTAGNEMALLGTAAGALFGGGGGPGKLASTLGVDELGVGQAAGTTPGTANGLQSTVVTVGKRLSSRAYLSFEQGASTATSLVKLRYKLNPRITLQFQTGTNNALDVLYTWAFD
jgi:translocation and assembly module TamB